MNTPSKWWRDPPATWGHEKNYLMTEVEATQYIESLKVMQSAITRALDNALTARKALVNKAFVPLMGLSDPQPVTIVTAMNFLIKMGRCKKDIMELLVRIAQQRRGGT